MKRASSKRRSTSPRHHVHVEETGLMIGKVKRLPHSRPIPIDGENARQRLDRPGRLHKAAGGAIPSTVSALGKFAPERNPDRAPHMPPAISVITVKKAQ